MQQAYLVTVGYNYIGAQADINVWNPRVDLPDDFTTAQIWLKKGNGPQFFESIEAGWMVSLPLLLNSNFRVIILVFESVSLCQFHHDKKTINLASNIYCKMPVKIVILVIENVCQFCFRR